MMSLCDFISTSKKEKTLHVTWYLPHKNQGRESLKGQNLHESYKYINIKGTQPSSHIGWVRVPKKGQVVNQMQNLKTKEASY